MKRIVVTLPVVVAALAFGLWRDTYVDPEAFDALAFLVGGLTGLWIAVVWGDLAIAGFDRLMDWIHR